jgi:putative redox protein
MATTVKIIHAGGTVFDTITESGNSVRVDGGTHEAGPGPMELVLVALGTCSAVTVVEFLAKMRQPLASLEVEVTGERRTDSPRVYERINVQYRVAGAVDRDRAERAIGLAETKYCSVWTMLAATVAMSHDIEFVDPE